MTKIIAISGRKQSGKNTFANVVNGMILKEKNLISDYKIDSKGQLVVETTDSNNQRGWGVFDVTRKDIQFSEYAERELWPYVKLYHFADYLKQISIDLFDLTPRQVYGSDEDKNTQTQYDMTARQFLQYLGTDVMRKIKDTVWVDHTIKTIKSEKPQIAIIPDVRFPNEIEAIHNAGGSIIRLTRDIFNSDHKCESSLDADNFDWKNFDHVVDNSDSSLDEFIEEVQNLQSLWSN